MKPEFMVLCKKIGYTFTSEKLLLQALSHRSVGKVNNERLEFFGDAILSFIIAEVLYKKQKEAAEGALSRLRASLVKGETLAKIANEIDLGQYLILGAGELKSGGHKRASILAGAVEALIGAIYLDADFDTCKKTVLKWFKQRLQNLGSDETCKDPKTRLQEYLQSKKITLPHYHLIKTTGAAHNQTFYIECEVQMLKKTVKGKGLSRRKAEQNAAEEMMRVLNSDK